MSFSKLQGRIPGDAEWTDIPNSTHAQADLTTIIDKMKSHGFRVRETDAAFQIIHPRTKRVEAEYRIW